MLDINNFIAIGKITKTIGIKGNLKIISLTDFPDRFLKLKKIFLFNEVTKQFLLNESDGNYGFEISECKVFDTYINIKFEGYNSIEKSGELKNSILMIDEKKRLKLEDGSFYFYELIGSEIFDKGVLIGMIVSIVNYGSGDLFSVIKDDKEILIPFRKEFVKNIDVIKKRIDVELIDGFLE